LMKMKPSPTQVGEGFFVSRVREFIVGVRAYGRKRPGMSS